jgi:uncharacterized protein YqfB (UPF0267 family)
MAKKNKYVVTFRIDGVTDPHDKPERMVVLGRKEVMDVINANLSDYDVLSFTVKKVYYLKKENINI